MIGGLGALDGVVLVDKPAGMTSHDVVAKIRRTFRVPKVGHGGTLDPAATGLLVILTGKGTKISERVMGHDKTYRGELTLGVETDSQDADGEVTARADEAVVAAVSCEAVEAAMRALTGDLMQTPPMVSAKKINGVPLYKLARKGQEVERKPAYVHVYRFRLEEWAPPRASFEVECTKGTYVRTLAHDVGKAVGVGAHLSALCRLKAGPFSVDEAHPLDEILAGRLEDFVLPLGEALLRLP